MTHLGKLVAVHFTNGKVFKGHTADFRPNGDFFHLMQEGVATPKKICTEGIKAVFFIKTAEGDPDHKEEKIYRDRVGSETKIWIEFTDGEQLAGYSNSFGSQKAGFYLFPSDTDSNLVKTYVFRSAVRRMAEGDEAEAASKALTDAGGARRKKIVLA
jgi:hypothetical protein